MKSKEDTKSAEKKEMHASAALRAYMRAAARYPLFLAGAIAGVVVVEAAAVASPYVLGKLIHIVSTTPPGTLDSGKPLLVLLGLFAAASFVIFIGNQMRERSLIWLEAKAMRGLYNDAFSYLIGHAHDFFITHFAGTLSRRVTRYARAFETVTDIVLLAFLPTFIYCVGIIAVLFAKSPLLGISVLVWTLVFLTLQYFMARWRRGLRAIRVAEDSKVTGLLSDAISNHQAVTTFAAAGEERSRFRHALTGFFSATLAAWRANVQINAVQGALAILIEVGMLSAGILLWQKGVLGAGDIAVIQLYMLGLFERVWSIGRSMRQFYDALSEASEMTEILETPYAIADRPGAPPLAVSAGAIAFENVTFRYEHAPEPVLRDFTLDIRAHEKVAFVGPSGAGKTTVTKLLLRLYDVSEGGVLIDGQDIRAVTQESVRAHIAFVPQEPTLFHRSLMDNIRYGRPEATDEEVIAAAKQAHCYEFISRYGEGFETHVGERGVKLSGGERQRVAIARAILKNAPILVLDEATSSLDSESEALIQDALARLMEGKTVIAIAHRLSTIMKMDRIVVMEGGTTTLSGTHDELLSHESNIYKKLWEIQAGGFIHE